LTHGANPKSKTDHSKQSALAWIWSCFVAKHCSSRSTVDLRSISEAAPWWILDLDLFFRSGAVPDRTLDYWVICVTSGQTALTWEKLSNQNIQRCVYLYVWNMKS
jgi:hypothetical protein